MVERRRVMDDRIDKMADDLSYLRGLTTEYMKNQQEVIKSLHERHENQNQTISKLKTWQDNANGRIWGMTVGVPAIIIYLAKVLGIIS